MRIEQLLYFISVAETGSLNKTANKFFISPQGLHKSLKGLEDELGLKLFIADKHGTHLTDKGNIFLCGASSIIRTYNHTREKLLAASNLEESFGEITLSCQPRVYENYLFNVINKFINHYPNIHVNINTKLTAKNIFESMQDSKTNFGLCILDKDDFQIFQKNPSYYFTEFSTEELYCCAHKDYFNEIPASITNFNESISKDLVGYLYETPFTDDRPSNASATTSLSMQKHLIEINKSFGMVLNREFELFYAHEKKFVLIPYDPPMYMHFICLHKNPSLFSVAETLFVDILKSSY